MVYHYDKRVEAEEKRAQPGLQITQKETTTVREMIEMAASNPSAKRHLDKAQTVICAVLQ
jgi:predicted RNase H-like nuclease